MQLIHAETSACPPTVEFGHDLRSGAVLNAFNRLQTTAFVEQPQKTRRET